MQICRFNRDRLGWVRDNEVLDVTSVIDALPAIHWPVPLGDPLMERLDALAGAIRRAGDGAERLALSAVRMESPVCNPSKIMAVPANYRQHVVQDTLDPGVDQGVHRAAMLDVERPVDAYGLFLKASSALVGPAHGIVIDWPDRERRVDHEVELAVVMGRTARHVGRKQALDHVAGYAIGLDISVRGAEDRSFRKSADSFAVLGPWLSTHDEIADPDDLPLWLSVNGEMRQSSSTAAMTVPVAELIEIASAAYTLYPGDILMTGTPEGVGPLRPGDVIRAGIDGIGEMIVRVEGGRR